VINNTVHPKELIIVDDGSTDNSLEILQEFSHLDFLKIIRFDQNKGFCNALNTGIENANGKYILRADPDDILMENRIETQYNYL
jgi:glycosyltransferase involved in cell wall biosynthesis